MTTLQRFEAKYTPEPNSGCWLWLGSGLPAGYGQMWNGDTVEAAHRISYKLFRGEIPQGLEIDHKCRVRCCVNPDHLELVTHKENMRRGCGEMGLNARKTHCKRGHAFDEKNTYWNKNGGRFCRACGAMHKRNRVRG
jgi:hypothetical protein